MRPTSLLSNIDLWHTDRSVLMRPTSLLSNIDLRHTDRSVLMRPTSLLSNIDLWHTDRSVLPVTCAIGAGWKSSTTAVQNSVHTLRMCCCRLLKTVDTIPLRGSCRIKTNGTREMWAMAACRAGAAGGTIYLHRTDFARIKIEIDSWRVIVCTHSTSSFNLVSVEFSVNVLVQSYSWTR
jgi:hypothetical protein